MKLTLENKRWELAIDASDIVEFDNYVDGFGVISCEDYKFDTVRVFISVRKETAEKEILVFPWKNGETYPEDEALISCELKNEINNLVKNTDFYRKLA